ncbi:replication initiator [Amycolatopsis cihanbeyliensis]|uniref:replication initiator n=1 Tax=Amycolatopsis cihanbeyliensis TaxID=1128664 RepID=UPI00114E0F42|nr:replication initiator [Amycolatopsis cihanbeyliensis]
MPSARSRLVGALSTEDERLSLLLRSGGYRSWRAKVEAVGGCAKPVRLAGSSVWETLEGRRVRTVEGSLFAACNNRRETRCPSCAQRYAADTFHLIRSGLTGGKGVAETVGQVPRLFVTLTAPSFGAVHNRPVTRTGKPRPCACGEFHHEHDTRLGSPLDPAGYDYVGAVLWQAHAPELWRRFTITLARHLACALGIRPSQLRDRLRVSYAKVAEYQRRGLVHFHAVVRVDGPTGPGSPAPAGATTELLDAVVRTAAASVSVDSPESATVGSRRLTWGEQIDCEPIAATDPDDPAQVVHDRQVAGYVAKYATKGTGHTSGSDVPIRSAEHIAELSVSEHARAMITTAWQLGGLPEFAGLRLRKWAHMLGFRGHFLTKSRRYSTTFTALRSARREHRFARDLADLGITDTAEVVVVNDWTMTGIGYHNDAERHLAEAIADTAIQRRKTQRTDLGEVA